MNEQTKKIFNGKEDALDFVNKVQAGFIATVDTTKDGNHMQPRVRGVLMWYADDSGFYFHTSKTKDLYTQLLANPRVEIAFASQQPEPAMLRIWGDIEFLEDNELKAKLISDRPWLLSYGDGKNLDYLVVFKIANASGKFWQNETNMKEKTVPVISF